MMKEPQWLTRMRELAGKNQAKVHERELIAYVDSLLRSPTESGVDVIQVDPGEIVHIGGMPFRLVTKALLESHPANVSIAGGTICT
jgi:hypothetical protein